MNNDSTATEEPPSVVEDPVEDLAENQAVPQEILDMFLNMQRYKVYAHKPPMSKKLKRRRAKNKVAKQSRKRNR